MLAAGLQITPRTEVWVVLIIFLKGIKLECFFKCGQFLQYPNYTQMLFLGESILLQKNFPYKSITV